jgi:hypothetical protein
MARLIDDLRASGKVQMPCWVSPKNERSWIDYAHKVMQAASDPDMPVLLIDNVAQYFYATSDKEHWNIETDFPNIAPPFKCFWVEWKMVTKIHSKEAGDTDVSKLLPQGGRVGQFFLALERDEFTGYNIPENARWIYWCDMWTDYHRPGIAADGPSGATFIAVDAEGRAIGMPWMYNYGDEEAGAMLKHCMAWFNPTLLAISFLHCKNVAMLDHVIDKPLAKKWAARHGGLRPVNYKTLVIEPLKQILRKEGGSDRVGIAKAMHICRGHFADYTQGRGLFGKYHGKFWMPSTVRGTKGKAAPREIEVKI